MVHELTEATGPGFLKLNDAVGLLLCVCFVLMRNIMGSLLAVN